MKRTEMVLKAVRIEKVYLRLLAEMAQEDPDRATVSTLMRRAIREYLQRHGKMPAKVR
jgi:hypothetical protein